MAPTRRIISLSLTLLLSLTSALLHHSAFAATLSAPAQANADSPLTITLDGVDNPRDFVTIVSASAAEGHYDTYAYTSNGNSVELFAPLEPGDYEIRWLAAESPYATRARHTLKVVAVSASVTAPASAAIASTISIAWQGPNHPRDFITLVPAGSAEGSYDAYTYTSKGSPLTLTAPTQPGNYEIRYLSGRGYKTLGRTAITITDTSASVQFTSPARIGQQLSVQWSGPANPREYITVVKAGSGEREYAQYTYVDKGNPLQLQLPDVPGEYEVRYLTADASRVLARAPLTIEAVTASVDGPASAVARSLIQVRWSGPNNPRDYIAITTPGKPAEFFHYGYTARGNPVTVEVPKQPGTYDIHYLTAQSNQSLARTSLTVTPANTPGKLQVQAAEGSNTAPAYGVVEVVLDASGSMLQKLDGKRRIDIAKTTLNQLLGTLKNSNQQFALRVFGHRKADACDTELLLPPAPARNAAITQTINKLEAKNLARTPIADSLQQVAQDLQAIPGPKLVILLTDGEETCDGDPAAAIKQLRAAGLDVRVNIVGFAIGEYALKQQFSDWAAAGGGAYFDAQDATQLQKALTESLQTNFMVLNAEGTAVASGTPGGDAVELPPGQYRIRAGNQELPATVEAGTTTTVQLR